MVSKRGIFISRHQVSVVLPPMGESISPNAPVTAMLPFDASAIMRG